MGDWVKAVEQLDQAIADAPGRFAALRRDREFAEQHDRLADGLCPHPDCGRKIPFGRLACAAHWSQLPITLRRLITAAWSAGEYSEHRRWKTEAFRFWVDGVWADPR